MGGLEVTLRRTRCFDGDPQVGYPARRGDSLQPPQSNALLARGKVALRYGEEEPLPGIRVVGMVIIALVPGEDVDVRLPARGICPHSPSCPEAAAGRDIEGRAASPRGRPLVPSLPRRGLLDLQPGAGRRVLAIPRRPIPTVHPSLSPIAPERGADNALDIVAATDVVHDRPVVAPHKHRQDVVVAGFLHADAPILEVT